MKLKNNHSSKFTPCPEYTGRAVCVDVTPLQNMPSTYGDRDVFRLVFEVDERRDDGAPFCVWSKPFTPSLNEKANFRRFLRSWRGRDLTKQEEQEFDTETLIGRPAFLVITHTESNNGETYANIAAITPHKESHGEPLIPSGKFIRKQDRETTAPGSNAAYRRVESPKDESGNPVGRADWMSTEVHVGKHAGVQLGDLDAEAVQKLLSNWIPVFQAMAKPKAADKRLHAALLEAKAALEGATPDSEESPY